MFYHSIGLSSEILPDTLFDILFSISSDILFEKTSDNLSGIHSDILSGISSNIPSGILSGVPSDIPSGDLNHDHPRPEIAAGPQLLCQKAMPITPGRMPDRMSEAR